MKMKLPSDKAHQLLQEILDGAEDRAIRRGACSPEDATDLLTVAFIAQCESFMEHALRYVPNDERLASEIFLHYAATAAQRRMLSNRMSKRCAIHLQNNKTVYLPNYHALLRTRLIQVLATRTTSSEIMRSGVVILSVGTLDGALTDICRELRRKGCDKQRTLIVEDALKARMKSFAKQLKTKELLAMRELTIDLPFFGGQLY